MAARAGVEPTTLRLRVIDLSNALPRPTDDEMVRINMILIIMVETVTHQSIEYWKHERDDRRVGSDFRDEGDHYCDN